MRTDKVVFLSLFVVFSFIFLIFLFFRGKNDVFSYRMVFDNHDIFCLSREFITKTEKKLDICVYSISNADILCLLKEALDRGVELRIITDDGNLKYVEHLIQSGARIYSDDDSGLMHCKYMISDDRDLWAGSTNLTDTGLHSNSNNILHTDDPVMIDAFRCHFDGMISGEYETVSGRNKYSADEILFSLYDDVFSRIIQRLSSARKNIKIGMYAFSDYRISHYLKILSSYGVDINVIADEEWNSLGSYSVVEDISKFGFAVFDCNEKGKMHEKFILIDDREVIFGSYNLTLSANTRNYEFVIITEKKEIVKEFTEHFDSLMKEIKNNG